MKNKKEGFFQSKVFYIIFSFIVSFFLWCYVAYSENPDIEARVRNIPVNFTGMEILADNNLVVTGIDHETVSIGFIGKRNTVTKLNDTNVAVTVDLTQITSGYSKEPGTYNLSYDVDFAADSMDFFNTTSFSNIKIADASAEYIKVEVERLVTEPVYVKGIYEGGIAAGYRAEPMQYSTDTITVSGPESVVDNVAYAGARIMRENVSETVTEECGLVLYDKSGKEITSSLLTMSQDKVTVTLPIMMFKDVPLEVKYIEGNSAVSGENVTCNIEPKTVSLSGDADVLEDINQIYLGTVDLNSFTTSYTETFTISIPEGVENITGTTTAEVNVQVVGMDKKEIETTQISTKNGSAKFNYEVVNKNMSIILRGPESSLDKITWENVRVVADLGEIENSIGTQSVLAKVYIDGFDDVDAIGSYKVTVLISNREGIAE